MMFSNKDLKRMIVPLFLEQLLVILVGLNCKIHRHSCFANAPKKRCAGIINGKSRIRIGRNPQVHQAGFHFQQWQ